MSPLVALGLVAGAAVAGFLFVNRNKTRAGVLPGTTRDLVKGKTYAVLTTITAQDGKPGPTNINNKPSGPIGTLEMNRAAAIIKATYEQLGFKFLSSPVPRDTGEASDFLNKKSSIWLFNAQWTLDSSKPGDQPPWTLSQDYVLLPVQ